MTFSAARPYLLRFLLICGSASIIFQFRTLLLYLNCGYEAYGTFVDLVNATAPLQEGIHVVGSHASNPLTIVIELNGHMANQLCKIGYGYGLAWILEEDYGIYTKPILRHQVLRKWKKAKQSVVECFPKLRELDFEAGNANEEFQARGDQQKEWLGDETHDILRTSNDCKDEACIRETLVALVNVLSNSTTTALPRSVDEATSNITLPFLRADTQANFGYIIDRYYERLRDFFQYDHTNPICCYETALPDETVFHIRAFFGELPQQVVQKGGFEELAPNKTAQELFSNHRPGDKVAVLSRSPTQVGPYMDALRAAGLSVRFVDATSHQGFCLLMSAKREMIGFSQSTFSVWAAFLGNATKARLYSLKSPGSIGWVGYNYTHPKLKDKMLMELYNSEEQDRIEREQGRL